MHRFEQELENAARRPYDAVLSQEALDHYMDRGRLLQRQAVRESFSSAAASLAAGLKHLALLPLNLASSRARFRR